MKVFEAIRILDRKGRFAPKVLDADGVEIRAGDRVWSTQLDEPHEWIVIDPHEDRDDSQTVLVSIGDRTGHAKPENLTHRAPVLSADGRPLEAGQTVWEVESGIEYEVVGIHTDEDSPVRVMRTDGSHLAKAAKPSTLTHERPVLDADGNRIEPAMDVWWVCEGDERGVHAEKLHVERVDEDGMVTCSPFNHGTWVELDSSELHVKKPVLDADGVPIKVGDTVYEVGENYPPFIVDRLPEPGAYRSVKVTYPSGAFTFLDPERLTHTEPEPPDSWERLEEDAANLDEMPCDYSAKDLVRRARALAERGK